MKLQLAVLFVIVLSAWRCYAQVEEPEPIWYWGGYAGINFNIHSAEFSQLPGVPNCCDEFSGGNGAGIGAGALFDIPFSNLLSVEARLGFAMRGALLLEEDQNIGNTENADGTDVVPVLVDHSIDGVLNTIDFEALLGISPAANITLQLGVGAGFFITDDFEQLEEIQTPTTTTFSDGRRIQNDVSGAIPENGSLHLAGIGGLRYRLPIGSDKYLAPYLRYSLPLTKISSVEWKAAAVQAGVAILFPVYSTPEIPVLQDTVYQRDTSETLVVGLEREQVRRVDITFADETIESPSSIIERTTISETYMREIPKVLAFSAGIQVRGLFDDGTTRDNAPLTIEELDVGETLPLLPYVFFEEGSADLTATNLTLLKPAEVASFNETQLSADAMTIYANNLNIIGSRLRATPGATLTITGCNNNLGAERGARSLSTARAQAVQQYLVDVWGIDEQRLQIKARDLPAKPATNDVADGQEENRRAEITSGVNVIMTPVTIKEISVSAVPPRYEILRTIASEAGLNRWNVNVRQGDNTLRDYQGQAAAGGETWVVLEPPSPPSDGDITFDLVAVDEAGQERRASARVPVRQLTIQKKRFEIKDDKRVEKFSLILFDFGKWTLGPLNAAILDVVRSRIEPTSTVEIYGYADRTGEQDFNRNLAAKRCAAVKNALNDIVSGDRLKVVAVGSDDLIYNNDLPEGRNYSRTVRIIVETPVRE